MQRTRLSGMRMLESFAFNPQSAMLSFVLRLHLALADDHPGFSPYSPTCPRPRCRREIRLRTRHRSDSEKAMPPSRPGFSPFRSTATRFSRRIFQSRSRLTVRQPTRRIPRRAPQSRSPAAALHGPQLFTGIVNYKLNHLPAAHDELANETRLEPKNAAGWMWLGVVELARNHPEAAAAALDKAAALDPTNVDILYHRGRAHLLISKESYSAMFKLGPDSSRVHEVLGQADAEAYRPDDAIDEFQLAIRAAPRQPGLNEELGDACWSAGKFQQADDAYSQEIKIDAANAIALYKLGSLRVTRNDAASGVPLLQHALALDPNLNDAHYYLGKGEAALGKDDSAIAHFRLATNPQGSEELRIMSWYQLATLYRNLHRPAEAGDALAAFRKMKATRDQRQ